MDKTHAPAFRTAIGGFNRADVNAYIAKLSRDFDEQNTALREEAAELKVQLENIRNELDKVLEQSEADKATGSENSELKTELERANNLIASQNEQLEEKRSELESVSAELECAKAKLERYSGMDEKLGKYDSMTARMGEIFMEATAESERIRTEAQTSASVLLRETEDKCRQRMIASAKLLTEFADTRRNEIAQLLESAQTEINKILWEFEQRSHAVANEALNAPLSAGDNDTDA